MKSEELAHTDSTREWADHLWLKSARSGAASTFHLVLLWYGRDPDRVGDSAAVSRRASLGRGLGAGAEPRVEFVRQRPGSAEPRPALDSPTLSRTQLELAVDGEHLSVKNVGRCKLRHNGVVLEHARASAGDVLTLENEAVFLVEMREVLWPPLVDHPPHEEFRFGAADGRGLVGECREAWALRESLARAAKAGGHVLIHGSTGAGKELAARALHQLSARAGRAFVSRNAATLPASLIDAELFGNVKNYPNVGSPERLGLIGEADGGTLLLDEIGELPEAQQTHLLRVLDRGGEYQALGDSRVRRSDLRVVALTNRPVEDLKQDFLARFPTRIRVPEIGERASDLPFLMRQIWQTLAEHWPELRQRFDRAASAANTWEPLTEPDLTERLVRHAFTDNYRELERLLRLAVSTSPGRYVAVTPELEAQMRSEEPEAPLTIDRDRIVDALARAAGSPSAAAKILGLRNRHVLYRLMKKYGVGSES